MLAKNGGYTDKPSRAMDPAEPEAVPAEDQARISRQAAASWPHLTALHEATRASQPLDQRLSKCRAQAKHLGVDAHRELRLVKLAISSGRPREHVEQRIAALEGKLFGR